MKPIFITFILTSLFAVGCGSKEQAAAPEEKIVQVKSSGDAVEQVATTFKAAPAETKQMADVAAKAFKDQDYATAITAIETLQAAPNLTIQQQATLTTSQRAIQQDLAARVVAGDPKAIAAVKAMRNRR